MTNHGDHTSEPGVPIDRIEPGDLLLVTPKPGEPLGALITRLDGSGFSHSAIALGGDEVASARGWTVGDGADLGGVRFDRIADFWDRGQSVLRLAVHPDVDRTPALEAVRRLGGAADDGTFSVPKILIVAIALASWDPGLAPEAARTLRRLAIEAGRAFELVPDDRSWFCAELVAHCYGRAFGVPALAPHRPTTAPPARENVLDTVLTRVTIALTDERARPAVELLLDEVGTTLPTFLDEAARRIVLSPVSGTWPVDSEVFRGRLTPEKQEFAETEMLPRALVTPRMLLDATWTAHRGQWVDGPHAPTPPEDVGRVRPVRSISP